MKEIRPANGLSCDPHKRSEGPLVNSHAREGVDAERENFGAPKVRHSLASTIGPSEEGANSFDPNLVCSQYTAEFMAGGPNGVVCGKNDESLRQAIAQRHAFFKEIAFKRAKILNVEETRIDDRYMMAKVHWHMTFEKQPGHLLDFKFFFTYFLFDSGSGPRVAFWISHEDEQEVMQKAGLIPGPNK